MSDILEKCFEGLTIEERQHLPVENSKDEQFGDQRQDLQEENSKEEKPQVQSQDLSILDEKSIELNRTGFVYDERMTRYHCIYNHPERPERILFAYEKLLSSGLADKCVRLNSRLATKDEILLKHTESHYELIESLVNEDQQQLEYLSKKFDSIYFHPNVTESALLSAGCTFELVEQILLGNVLNGAAVVRPPGHHAESDYSMGFCHFNNVALAAMLAITKHNVNRILIVDWDIHYGNATHKMFNDDPRVLYFSLHRYQFQQFWPNLVEANYDAVGSGAGEGFNIHVAWNKRGIRDCEYLYAFDNLLVPILKQYDPELILVSCGFDSGQGDPLGGCNVTPAGYAHMTKKLMSFAGGKVALILEGGYNLNTIANSMEACVSTLLGNPPPDVGNEEPDDSPCLSVANTFLAVSKYWTVLEPLREKIVELHTRLTAKKNRNEIYEGVSSDDESEDAK